MNPYKPAHDALDKANALYDQALRASSEEERQALAMEAHLAQQRAYRLFEAIAQALSREFYTRN